MLDADGFCRIDQAVFALKNPEKGGFQFVKAFFTRSRVLSVSFMYHAVSTDFKLVPSPRAGLEAGGPARSSRWFGAALRELSRGSGLTRRPRGAGQAGPQNQQEPQQAHRVPAQETQGAARLLRREKAARRALPDGRDRGDRDQDGARDERAGHPAWVCA